jgi:hypothetical protein
MDCDRSPGAVIAVVKEDKKMFHSMMMASALLVAQAPIVPGQTELPAPVKTPSADFIISQPTDGHQGIFMDPPKEEPRTRTIVGTVYPVQQASDEPGDPFSGSVTINQDSFFGFYPILSGSYAINDKVAFTFYGLFWTNPGFTPSGTGGTGLWTEFGVGASFKVLDGAVTINPQLGFLNGVLLSGADRSIAFEGLVSQISISHASKYLEGQFYTAYYTATAAPSNNDFVHMWVTGGVRPFADNCNWTQIISTGFHFEQLYQTKSPTGNTGNLYTWLGPYLQFTLPNNVFMRVNAGWDLQDDISGTFYKATMGYVF